MITDRASALSKWISSTKVRRVLYGLACWCAIVAVYVWLASAGTLSTWPPQMLFHDQQADAFRAGQLHLPMAPDARLAEVPDPYDIQHASYWVMDFSYHQGRYYLYWGPVPGALLALGKSALGVERPVGDSVLAFAFTSLLALVAVILIPRLARRHFPGLPRGMVTLSVFSFAFCAPLAHGVSSGSVYVASITGGQAFAWVGLCCAIAALAARRSSLAWAAGVAFALALGCRVSLAPAIALVGLGFALFSALPRPSVRTFLCWLLPIAVPCSLAIALLLVYNFARFDRFLEFGTGIQLSAWKFRASFDYLLANLHSYLLRGWESSCEFPYLLQGRGIPQEGPWGWLPVPADYATVSPMVGVLWGMPVVWGILLLLVGAAHGFRRRLAVSLGELRSEQGARTRERTFFIASLLAFGSVTGFPELGLNVATMRYEADVSSGLFLLGLLGLWAVAARDRSGDVRAGWQTGAARGFAFALLGANIVIGLLIGYQGYNHHVRTHNPDLHVRLVRALSLCSEP